MRDTTTPAAGTERALGRRELTDTRGTILEAARNVLLQDGYARLSTRRVADLADVPLSQIHYHFGSKQQLILEVLRAENARLLDRQAAMFAGPEPLWKQWDRACDFLEVDLESGYVRILQEMVAAGWSDTEVAAEVRTMLGGWLGLLTTVGARESERTGGLGPFTPAEIGALMGVPFLGAESTILLGFTEAELPIRSALRKIGAVIRHLEEVGDLGGDAGS